MKQKKIGIEAKSAFVFTLATVFSRGLAVISMPIFTRLMTTADIGVVNLYSSWYSMVSIVSTLALSSGGYSLAMKEYAAERDQYESSVLTLTSLMSLSIGVIYFINPTFWSELFGLSPSLMCLMLLGLFVSPAWDFWTLRQRFEYRYKLSFVLSVSSAVLATGLSIFAVVSLSSGSYASPSVAEGRLIANYLVIYGFAAAMWILLMVRGRTFFNRRFWKFSLRLSLPLIGYSIASQVLNVSDRVMIADMVGAAETGIYGVLYTASSISLFVWTAINASFIPYLFQNIDEEGHAGIRSTSTSLLGTFALISIAISWMAPEIIKILATADYFSAIAIMPPIAAGVFLTAISNMYSNVLVYYRKTKYIMFAAIAAAAVNVVLNLLFIPVLGYMAAAYSTLVSYVVLAISQFMWARVACRDNGRKLPVYEDRKLMAMSAGTIAMTMAGLVLYQLDLARYVSCVLLLVIGAAVFLRSRKAESAT